MQRMKTDVMESIIKLVYPNAVYFDDDLIRHKKPLCIPQPRSDIIFYYIKFQWLDS